MNIKKININFYIIFFLFCTPIFFSCSTGIEKTKTISLKKESKKVTTIEPEDTILNCINIPFVSDWKPGKQFIISDNKANVVFDIDNASSEKFNNLQGTVINFTGTKSKRNPAGQEDLLITFSDGSSSYQYNTGKTSDEASSAISSMDIPMLIDLQIVSDASKILKGLKLWTKTQLWYDSLGNKIDGRKFVPVTITDVQPGDMVFPLHLSILDENQKPAFLFLNIKNNGMESRTFQTIFSLSDPKIKYSNINKDTWSLIQQGKLQNGMTKEECKLSVGNPSDVNSGHDWNNTIDLWRYSNGGWLRFQDGVLIDFRY